MTNYKKAISGTTRPHNQKDGVARPPDQAAQYEAQGFSRIDWNRWEYTWKGKFPTFQLAPGIFKDAAGMIAAGMIAKFSPEIIIHFPYGTPPSEIKARLDDEILAIMRYDAEIDSQPLAFAWSTLTTG